MTRQDTELLNFFEYKAKPIIFYNNKVYTDAFNAEVSPLFTRNSAVRHTLLAVAAIIQLNFLVADGHDGALIKSDQLLQAGMNHFQKALTFQQTLVASAENQDNIERDAIKELLSSCMLQMGYLVVNVGREMPLLSLDRNQVDLITLLGAHKFIRENYLPKVIDSKIPFLFPSASKIPEPLICEYYLTESLRLDLNDVYQGSSCEIKIVLEKAIDVIDGAIYRTMKSGLPYPIIATTIQLSSDEFRCYLYQANDFALRILFVCAALAAMSKFCTRRFDNIYFDYVLWYKDRQYSTMGKFQYVMDEKLYFLVLQTDFELDTDTCGDFNPIEVARFYEQLS